MVSSSIYQNGQLPSPNPTDSESEEVVSGKSKRAAPTNSNGKPSSLTGGTVGPRKPKIWWENAIFFVGMHVMALVGIVYLSPWRTLDTRTLWLCLVCWQSATFGITLGYHRLWSHRSYSATMPLRIFLAVLGSMGFQGSIKWWVLRHRLHHRWTDSDDDPYDAQKGLLYSHMGWIFFRPTYPKMKLIEKRDLEADPVVRFQHKYYIPVALASGLLFPTLVGWTYGDAMGGYVWGGVMARIMIWHGTFLINSFAHYLGDQAYSHDVTARGNLVLALLTAGEGNHNFHHAFPNDFRNGPRITDFDPTKWLIFTIHVLFPFLIPKIHITPESDILKARSHVLSERADSLTSSSPQKIVDPESLPIWKRSELLENVKKLTSERMKIGALRRPLCILIDGWVVEASNYSSEHPGGIAVLRRFGIGLGGSGEGGSGDGGERKEGLIDASDAFNGGLNNHQWPAREKMRSLRIARVVES